MNVAVIVPWRGGCPHRERAARWVLDRYRSHHPAWQLVLSEPPPGPWIKAAAVMPAARAASADVLVIADADVWCDRTGRAVDAVAAGRAWAVPHRRVHRLDRDATSRLIEAHPASTPQRRNGDGRNPAAGLVEPPYRAVTGGGIVVVRRDVIEQVPLDPRFEGWGGEDHAWGYALAAMRGQAWRGAGVLIHLWHPPQPRATRAVGSAASEQLRRRYLAARGSRAATNAILTEIKE